MNVPSDALLIAAEAEAAGFQTRLDMIDRQLTSLIEHRDLLAEANRLANEKVGVLRRLRWRGTDNVTQLRLLHDEPE